MPYVHGKNTHVYLEGSDISAYLNSATWSADRDKVDTTTYGTTWKSPTIGLLHAKADLGGFFDLAALPVENFALALAPGTATICPGGGTTIGDQARLMSIVDTSYALSVPVGGVVAFKASLDATCVGLGYVLHPLVEDTNTTTGATRDDSASTSTGWTASLHAYLIDGGGWDVKLQDASASNFSDGADVTGGAFVRQFIAGGQFITSATNVAVLRRYVRYVATRVGGSAGDGITFVLGIARNR